ncbi:hypothetical protein G9A89_009945 [Geosiphon pyriformis]|nr:hypothetical protein G9A89_009945 [Geosiphon pyriformis]
MAQPSGSQQQNLGTEYTQNPNSQNYLSLLVTPKDAQSNNLETNQNKLLISNIPPAASTEDKTLAAIFLFDFNKITPVPLFSRATLDTKPIMAMYIDAKVNGYSIKLILNSCQVNHTVSTKIIMADRAIKTPIGEIDNFLFEVNGLIISIKVLVMEATQYQALVGNNWLSKTNMLLDWTTQELQISQNGQHMQVPVTCGYFKPITTPSAPLIKFEKKKRNLPGRTILPDEEMWKDIPRCGKTCDMICQYMILINDWISKGTPIDDVWKQALQ